MAFPTLSRRIFPLLAAFSCLVGAALRGVALPSQLADVDAVNLGRSLREFDVFSQSPHFPGYPVLVALARGVRALGVRDEVWALTLPGILLWPVAGTLLFFGLERRIGRWPALGAVAFASLAPGAVLTSGWPASEGLGLSLLALAVGLLCMEGARLRVAGAFTLGLLLGVRLSWWPVVGAAGLLVLWLRVPRAGRLAASALLGILVWLVPMLVMFDPSRLWALALGFSQGHMDAWGGTALGSSSPGIFTRAARVVWGVWDASLGAAWPARVPLSEHAGESSVPSTLLGCVVWLSALGALTHRFDRRWLAFAALTSLPYVVWLVGFQNVMKPRHLVPLLPALGAVVGAGLGHLRSRAIVAPALGALLLTLCWPRAQQQHSRVVPAVALERWLVQSHRPEGLLLFAGQEARVLERYLPMYRVLRPVDGGVLNAEAERAASQGVTVWVTTSAPGYRELSDQLVPLHTFTFPHSVRPHDSRLGVSRFVPRGAFAQKASSCRGGRT